MEKTRPGLSSSNSKPGKKGINSYIIHGTNKFMKIGECVLIRPSKIGKPPYVARVEKIDTYYRNNVKLRVRWYYKPEEALGGRRQFHGAKEIFLSDHYDVQSAHTIEGKCTVHSFKNYTKLENVGAEDYFCRFEYEASSRKFTPDMIAVYHHVCVGMNIETAKNLDRFTYEDCMKGMKKSQWIP